MKIAKNIKKERKLLKLKQEELAKKLNTSQQNVSLWERGIAKPDIDTLIKLSKIFQMTLDQLCDVERKYKQG